MPRGWPAEPLVRLVNRGQQFHAGHSVMALKTGSKRRLRGDPSGLDIGANQPRGLRPAESGHVLDVGPQKPLGPPLLKRVLVIAEQALHPAVNLRAAASDKPHTLRGGKKCLDLYQTQLLCSKHADHPSSAWLYLLDRPWRKPSLVRVSFACSLLRQRRQFLVPPGFQARLICGLISTTA